MEKAWVSSVISKGFPPSCTFQGKKFRVKKKMTVIPKATLTNGDLLLFFSSLAYEAVIQNNACIHSIMP